MININNRRRFGAFAHAARGAQTNPLFPHIKEGLKPSCFCTEKEGFEPFPVSANTHKKEVRGTLSCCGLHLGLHFLIKYFQAKSDTINHFFSIIFTTFAGLPTATALSGISLVTILPVPIIAFSPMVTPGSIFTLAPIQAFFFI